MRLLEHRHGDAEREVEKHGQVEETLGGSVRGYNYSPKGEVEGLLIEVGHETHQVNMPLELGLAVAIAVPVGQSVEVTVLAEGGERAHHTGVHAIHRLLKLNAANGYTFVVAGSGKPEAVTVEGVVTHLNFTKHGDTNGIILETGEFLHLKPDGMKRSGIRLGDRITAEGRARQTALGNRAIEVELLNGIAIK